MSIFKRIFNSSREEPRWWDVDKPGDPELPGLEKPQTENSQKDFDGMIPPTALTIGSIVFKVCIDRFNSR